MGNIKHLRIKALEAVAKDTEITIRYIINRLEDPNWEFEYEATQ